MEARQSERTARWVPSRTVLLHWILPPPHPMSHSPRGPDAARRTPQTVLRLDPPSLPDHALLFRGREEAHSRGPFSLVGPSRTPPPPLARRRRGTLRRIPPAARSSVTRSPQIRSSQAPSDATLAVPSG